MFYDVLYNNFEFLPISIFTFQLNCRTSAHPTTSLTQYAIQLTCCHYSTVGYTEQCHSSVLITSSMLQNSLFVIYSRSVLCMMCVHIAEAWIAKDGGGRTEGTTGGTGFQSCNPLSRL